MRKDYSRLWSLPPPLPRRWPGVDVTLLVLLLCAVLAAVAVALR
jgi:hypothetical protein